jgi:drug/metabolite transporter (DMT)-like permease
LTTLALIAFAANSVLCRLALGGGAIDAASFTLIRLGAGAATLALIRAAQGTRRAGVRGWAAPAMLFIYAAAFSFAYRSLGAGTGALILFGSVQLTMMLLAARRGERLRRPELVGVALAIAGMVYLFSPGLTGPNPVGAALMVAAGVAWGLYSILGAGSADPVAETARSFAWSVPAAVVVSLVAARSAHVTATGAWLAVLSGAIASGVGYAVWYAALRGLTAIRAAIVQLAVPALAALGGVLVLGESLSLRLVLAAALILGGVGAAVAGRARPRA